MDPSGAVYALVRTIPRGAVATYGQVAEYVEGAAVTARQVGGIMAVCPPDVPWQRVVGSGGHLVIGKRSPLMAAEQRARLEAEGVEFLSSGCVDMARFGWQADPTGSLFSEE